jgi:hypothetical protein
MKHAEWKTYCLTLLLALAVLTVSSRAAAVTRFGNGSPEKKAPAPLVFDDIWFYEGGSRIIPEISLRWLTVVIDARYAAAGGFENTYDTFVPEKAKSLIRGNSELVDYLYDANLAEDACFFRLRDGLKRSDLQELINRLNQGEAVLYTHPAIILQDRAWAFFNTFQLVWKAGADRQRKAQLLQQAQSSCDDRENFCRVNVLEIPFFRAIDLLAEDISVLSVKPYLVELKPSIRVRLALSMNGGRIGDAVPFTFSIEFSDRVSIDPSSIANINLRPSSIQKELFDCSFDPYDYTKVITKSPIIITGRITFYAPGEFVIPSVTVSYTCPSCSGETVRAIETGPAVFRVASLIPSVKDDFTLLVPEKPVQPDYRTNEMHRRTLSSAWQAAAGLAAGLLCLAYIFAAFLRRRRHLQRKAVRTADELIAERLRVLVQAAPAHAHWQYLAEAGTLLREYISARFSISGAQPGGSAQCFVAAVKNDLPGQYTDPLETVLTAIDNAVAREQETCPDVDQIRMEILRLLDLTGPQAGA